MKDHPNTGHRHLLLLAILAFSWIALPVHAGGDNDGVGVLPSADEDSNDDSSVAAATVGLGLWGEQDSAAIVASRGSFDIDRTSSGGTELSTAESPESALIEAADINEPLVVADLDEGARLQGHMTVQPAEDLALVMRAPEEHVLTIAVLLFESGYESIEAMIDDPSSGQMHGALALGALAEVDVVRLDDLVKARAGSLPGSHVTLLVVTVDDEGAIHVTGARMAHAEGSEIELLAD